MSVRAAQRLLTFPDSSRTLSCNPSERGKDLFKKKDSFVWFMIRLIIVSVPLGLLSLAALLTYYAQRKEDGGWYGRTADKIMDWVSGDKYKEE